MIHFAINCRAKKNVRTHLSIFLLPMSTVLFFLFPIIFLFSFCLWHLLFVCVFLTYVLCAFFPRVSGIFLIFLPASSSIHHHCATFLSLVFLWPSSFWRTLHIFPRLFRRVKRTKQKLSYTLMLSQQTEDAKRPRKTTTKPNDNNKIKIYENFIVSCAYIFTLFSFCRQVIGWCVQKKKEKERLFI